jgi:peptidoglycan/LPS O-acetylase OafA/YrhL
LHAAWLLKERSGALTGVHNFIHSFRMEAFFVIAGFFAAIMLSKYSPEEFLRRRLVRLTVPMIFCGLTFNTLLACAHREKWYDVSFLVTPNYWLDRDWMAHLWFLGTLIVYVLVAYGVHKAWPHIDRTLRQRRLSFPVFFGVVVITQYAVSQLGHVVPSTPWGTSWIIADKIDTFDYFTYFVVGYFLFHHQELLDDLVDRKFVNAACAASYWLAVAFLLDYRGGTHLIDILAGANSLAMCGLLFWVGRRYFNVDNPIVQSLSDMSYTVYLVHWPIMAILYRGLVRFRLPVDMAFATLVIVTGVLSIAFHVYVVQRSDFMSFAMNGRRVRDGRPATGVPRVLSTRLFPRL